MTQSDEKFFRWLNAYLDGTLSADQRTRFEDLAAHDPRVREQIDLHRDAEATLRRLFALEAGGQIPHVSGMGEEPPSESIAGQLPDASPTPFVDSGRPKRRGFLRPLLATAAVLLLAAGSWLGWQVWSAWDDGAFYEASEKTDFREDWKCEDEREFQTTFWYRLSSGVTLAEAQLPPGPHMLGLKYTNDPEDISVYLMGKVDGRGVIVRVRRKDDAKYDYVFTKGLTGFRKETADLTMIEITPLDKPHFLDAMSQTTLPQAWMDNPKLPID